MHILSLSVSPSLSLSSSVCCKCSSVKVKTKPKKTFCYFIDDWERAFGLASMISEMCGGSKCKSTFDYTFFFFNLVFYMDFSIHCCYLMHYFWLNSQLILLQSFWLYVKWYRMCFYLQPVVSNRKFFKRWMVRQSIWLKEPCSWRGKEKETYWWCFDSLIWMANVLSVCMFFCICRCVVLCFCMCVSTPTPTPTQKLKCGIR